MATRPLRSAALLCALVFAPANARAVCPANSTAVTSWGRTKIRYR